MKSTPLNNFILSIAWVYGCSLHGQSYRSQYDKARYVVTQTLKHPLRDLLPQLSKRERQRIGEHIASAIKYQYERVAE